MTDFLTTYGGSLLVGAIVIAIVSLIVAKLIKDKRSGKSLCGGDCKSCGGHCQYRNQTTAERKTHKC